MECAEMKKGDIRDALPWVEDYAMSKRNGTGLDTFVYDSDGMGAPVVKLSIQDKFDAKDVPIIHFHGSGEVIDKKDECLDLNKSNGDAFANYRAQSCYGLRRRFERTYEAIEKGVYTDPDTLISISSTCEGVTNLIAELSRPQRKYRGNGKILVESKPEMRSRGVSSPNLFDVANMAFAVDSVKAGRPVRVNFESEWG